MQCTKQFMQRRQTNETNLQKTNNNTSSSIFSDAILFSKSVNRMTDKVLEAVREASISIACLMDDCDFVQVNHHPMKILVLQKDIEHIQDQVAILEDYLGTKYHDFKTDNILVNTWLQNYRRETNG